MLHGARNSRDSRLDRTLRDVLSRRRRCSLGLLSLSLVQHARSCGWSSTRRARRPLSESPQPRTNKDVPRSTPSGCALGYDLGRMKPKRRRCGAKGEGGEGGDWGEGEHGAGGEEGGGGEEDGGTWAGCGDGDGDGDGSGGDGGEGSGGESGGDKGSGLLGGDKGSGLLGGNPGGMFRNCPRFPRRRSESVYVACPRTHSMHLPSSHSLAVPVLQRDATSVSRPIASRNARRASGGSPRPCGLPALCGSKATTRELPCSRFTLKPPWSSMFTSTSKGWRVSTLKPRPGPYAFLS